MRCSSTFFLLLSFILTPRGKSVVLIRTCESKCQYVTAEYRGKSSSGIMPLLYRTYSKTFMQKVSLKPVEGQEPTILEIPLLTFSCCRMNFGHCLLLNKHSLFVLHFKIPCSKSESVLFISIEKRKRKREVKDILTNSNLKG